MIVFVYFNLIEIGSICQSHLVECSYSCQSWMGKAFVTIGYVFGKTYAKFLFMSNFSVRVALENCL